MPKSQVFEDLLHYFGVLYYTHYFHLSVAFRTDKGDLPRKCFGSISTIFFSIPWRTHPIPGYRVSIHWVLPTIIFEQSNPISSLPKYLVLVFLGRIVIVSVSIHRKRVSPHVLRHTCAMTGSQGNHRHQKVSLVLGHSTMQTTEIYLQADATEKSETVELIVPPKLRAVRFRATDKLLSYSQVLIIIRSKISQKKASVVSHK